MSTSSWLPTALACLLAAQVSAAPRAPGDADYHDNGRPDRAQVALGRLLFFDKILSGNRNISCATCHHPMAGSGDGLALPVGEGGRGLGITRSTGDGVDAIHERVPRNAPPLFNLGAREFTVFFHDGRLTVDPGQPSGFQNPAGDDLPRGLSNILAAQAMFPVTSATEMAGQPGENAIADAAAAGDLAGPFGVWAQLAARLQNNAEYVSMFTRAFDDIRQASDITYAHAANAIAAFEARAFRADDSPYDRYVRGDLTALSDQERRGMLLFYGDSGCYQCHSGPFQTDHDFRAIAMPQIGPGKGDGALGRDDFGRERVTLDRADRYRFRVPTLRNVALTAPYGHDGAFNTLGEILDHHRDPLVSLEKFNPVDAALPPRDDLDDIDGWIHADWVSRQAIARANELSARPLPEDRRSALLAFLRALTDPASVDQRHLVPMSVPSGLPIFD